jgi:hypothetical protein
VVAAVVVVGAGIVAAVALLSGGSENSEPLAVASDVECERGERLEYHVHTHLTLVVQGEPLDVAENIGIRQDCIFWLHTHSPNGILHVEAPRERDFTLGQFFGVWGQPLSSDRLLGNGPAAGQEVQATFNGEPWAGDPADIPLEDLGTIVLEYGPPFIPPPQFDWNQQ